MGDRAVVTLAPAPHDSYAAAALARECDAVAATRAGRNAQLNRSAFALGQLVGVGVLDRHEVERRLYAAAEACGYVGKDGPASARATIRSGIEKGEQEPRALPAGDGARQIGGRSGNVVRLPAAEPPARHSGGALPAWTLPNDKGRPKLFALGQAEPDRIEGEIRRHAYRRDRQTVRVKVKTATGWLDFYRVRRPSDGAEGWQARKPAGFSPTPYVGRADAFDPFDPECRGEDLYWPEGEKDVDSLQALGLCAFTFGGSNDVPDCAALLHDRVVVVLADHDEPGATCAAKKVELAQRAAASVRVVSFPELGRGKDVTDWLDAGGTAATLAQRVAAERDLIRPEPLIEAERDLIRPVPLIEATPFRWIDPSAIPPRGWIYGRHYIRKFVSCTVSPGGVGKSSLAIVEALAIVSGRPLLKVAPIESTVVWYWNGEDPQDELDRRVMAAAMLYGMAREDVEGRLFVDTGRAKPIIVASQTRDGVTIAQPIVTAVKETIRAHRIGLLIIDPFVSSHRVTENDNGAIETVATIWAQIADETGCAVELIHHSRKTGGAEVTVEDGRGAVALLNKARSARALNAMTEEEAESAGVENRRVYFRHFAGKSNLAPPVDASTWVKLESRSLDNARGNRPPDEVGVATFWEFPSLLQDVELADLRAIQTRVRDGQFRADAQASDWVGHVVADVLGLDASRDSVRKKVKKMLALWIGNRMFKVVKAKDDTRHEKNFVRVDQWAS